MLRLPPFELYSADSLAEAAAFLEGEGPGAQPLAGGTDLWPNMKRRHQVPRALVSLGRLTELRRIRITGESSLGATVTLAELADHRLLGERYPALARAAASISSPPLRNLGTIGGNLCIDTRCTYLNQPEPWRRAIDYCLKKDGDVCWVAPGSTKCWAHSASDTAPVLCALRARVRLVQSRGDRAIPVEDLFRDDGVEPLAKRADEIVSEVLLPAESDSAHCRSAFLKLRRRGSIDFSVLTVAVALWLDRGGEVQRARIALGAVAPRPVLADDAAGCLVGHPLTPERISQAARLARRAAAPLDNTDFQPAWRGTMIERYTERALLEAVD